MARMIFITKTYRPDFEAFVTLHQSILKHSAPDVEHLAIVPDDDLELFASIPSPRLTVRATRDFLPANFRSVARVLGFLQRMGSDGRHRQYGEMFVDLRRPWHPVRGWIIQQIVKLSAVAASDADVVVTLDSDAALIRPVTVDTFLRSGVVRFYRKPAAIHEGMPRHITWHKAARALVGISDRSFAEPPPDYISAVFAWDPTVVQRLLGRVSAVAGTHWASAIASEWQFSECILYGVFLDAFATTRERGFVADTSLCRVYWGSESMGEDAARQLVGELSRDDVALIIQSTSETSKDMRCLALRLAEERSLAFRLDHTS